MLQLCSWEANHGAELGVGSKKDQLVGSSRISQPFSGPGGAAAASERVAVLLESLCGQRC